MGDNQERAILEAEENQKKRVVWMSERRLQGGYRENDPFSGEKVVALH